MFGKWISIKDMLPSDDNKFANEWDWVLVAGEVDLGTAWTMARWSKSFGWQFFENGMQVEAPFCGDAINGFKLEDITHWMPIPEIEL